MTDTAIPKTTPTLDQGDERVERTGPIGALRNRMRTGELGALPVLVGLIVIVIVFQSQNSNFLSPENIVTLSRQIAGLGVIALGINLVLLLGEIDLSIAQVSGLTAVIMTILAVRQDLGFLIGVGVALLIGAAIGALQGWLFAKVGVPAFVVTLAGLLGWYGVQLQVLGTIKSDNLPDDSFPVQIAYFYFPEFSAYVIGLVVVVGYLAFAVVGASRRRAGGLSAPSITAIVVRTVLLGAAIFAFLVLVNQDFGLVSAFVILIALVLITDFVLKRTRYGRSIYAVGGNVEAARRAGISVAWVRISVFMLCSLFGTIGGILIAGNSFFTGSLSGDSAYLLNAIAAAVIGGTSLFGGRGSAWAPFFGVLVIGSITNGLNLIGFNTDAQKMITAVVLLAAVVLDSLSRRSQRKSGH